MLQSFTPHLKLCSLRDHLFATRCPFHISTNQEYGHCRPLRLVSRNISTYLSLFNTAVPRMPRAEPCSSGPWGLRDPRGNENDRNCLDGVQGVLLRCQLCLCNARKPQFSPAGFCRCGKASRSGKCLEASRSRGSLCIFSICSFASLRTVQALQGQRIHPDSRLASA